MDLLGTYIHTHLVVCGGLTSVLSYMHTTYQIRELRVIGTWLNFCDV